MSEIVYLNGKFLPIEEAHVPVLDRGFIFGDGVYEVIPVYSKHPFRLAEHLRRLQYSLDKVRISDPFSETEWTQLVADIVGRNAGEDQSVYLQVTRGVAKRDHAFPKGVKPTVFMMSNPLVTPAPALVESGVACISAQDYRWLNCDIKSVSLLGNCLLRQLSADVGATETILFRDGQLTEASASNVFVVRDGVLLTPPKDHLVLPGITYDVVLEIARAREFQVEVRAVSEAEVRNADEIWVTSSTKEVLAVTMLDGKPVGDGKPGPLFRRMHALYQQFKQDHMRKAA
ncbi:MAG: D-amino acid aminotransferase [Burkholderiales bacterium]|nr:D-amino acid aminotransferase [Burkholderiales bacterium]MDP2397993.1 D-amino acid aminotransferase [Burkholderiales bacterium]